MIVWRITLHFMILGEKKIEIKAKILLNNHLNWVIIKLQNKGLKIKKNKICNWFLMKGFIKKKKLEICK